MKNYLSGMLVAAVVGVGVYSIRKKVKTLREDLVDIYEPSDKE